MAPFIAMACAADTKGTTNGGGGDAGGTPGCGNGATMCGTTCTVLDYDPNNCGACGTVCADGEVCTQGACGVTCQGGTEKCGDLCVNTSNDPANCGACGTACPMGQVCVAGQCAVSCAAGGGTDCSGVCVDTNNDPANCGGCGQQCAQDEVCKGGQCASECGIGMTKCGETCADLKISEEHCGMCDNACKPGQDCVDGACAVCDDKVTDCDGDGWMTADGDCCDKSGSCGLEPELVNPGAIEVVGNGIDDNCNGKTDLFDLEDTVPCDGQLASDSADAKDFVKAMGVCRQTEESPAALKDKTWGLIDAKLLKADGTAIGDAQAHSIRGAFGAVKPATLEGTRVVVLSSGIAADGTQTQPGPNGGAPNGGNVTTSHSPSSAANIQNCNDPLCIKDWFTTANPPLKNANELPVAPNCGMGNVSADTANDSVMLYMRLRAPTNAKAFSFNSYFFSAEYPEYVCTTFNDQFVALVDTPGGVPSPIANPIDKNLLTYKDSMQKKWPIGINIASGTELFSVCESQATNPGCWDTEVSAASCGLGASHLAGTGFEHSGNCLIGGGTYWLTTSGNLIPGDIVELRIVIWDVGDTAYDSLALLDGFKWLPNATVPGTD